MDFWWRKLLKLDSYMYQVLKKGLISALGAPQMYTSNQRVSPEHLEIGVLRLHPRLDPDTWRHLSSSEPCRWF